MTGSIIDRVARAAWERRMQGMRALFPHDNSPGMSETWETMLPSFRALWREVARTSIEAMREPTEDMLGAGDSKMPEIAKGQDITTGRDALAEAWPAMIDAALKET